MKRILVSNDDGILGPGLEPLIRALEPLGRVLVIVPESERSTASHALTLHKPLRLKEFRPEVFTLSGTPADCARFGLLKMLKGRADLVVSGINRGFNMGEDVLYSGTVGAATEGALLGIPSLAVSQGTGRRQHFDAGAVVAARVARHLLRLNLKGRHCFNLNVPCLPLSKIRGVRAASLGERRYDQEIAMRSDPGGRDYYWMLGRFVSGVKSPGSDISAVKEGFASLTPLLTDITDRAALETVHTWRL